MINKVLLQDDQVALMKNFQELNEQFAEIRKNEIQAKKTYDLHRHYVNLVEDYRSLLANMINATLKCKTASDFTNVRTKYIERTTKVYNAIQAVQAKLAVTGTAQEPTEEDELTKSRNSVLQTIQNLTSVLDMTKNEGNTG
jgi:hypothetical protein